MKKLANLLILFGSGLAAYGITSFDGSFFPQDTVLPSLPGGATGSVGWSHDSQIEIVIGVISLVYGLLLRKDSN